MSKQTIATIVLAFMASNYLAFQAGQTVTYYKATAKGSTSSPATAPGARVYGVNQVLKFSPSRLDFGKIPDGSPQRKTVMFENPGSEPVVVRKVRASCECTIALIEETTVPPGGKGELVVMVNPAMASTEFAVSVSVEYVDKPQVDRLLISGEVDRKADLATPHP